MGRLKENRRSRRPCQPLKNERTERPGTVPASANTEMPKAGLGSFRDHFCLRTLQAQVATILETGTEYVLP